MIKKEKIERDVAVNTNKQTARVKRSIRQSLKLIMIALVIIIGIIGAYGCEVTDDNNGDSNDVPKSEQQANEDTSKPDVLEATVGEENALGSAVSYLEIGGFSKKSLREQLDYEGYSSDEIDYAIKNCNADWMEQAALSAQNYIDTMNFSRSGLIEQLKFEGFTDKQANHGADSVGY